MMQREENLRILIFFWLPCLTKSYCSSALKESFYNLQYSEFKENLIKAFKFGKIKKATDSREMLYLF